MGLQQGVVSYSGPVAVEVRVTVDLRQWGYGNLVSPLPQAHCNSQPHCRRPIVQVTAAGFSSAWGYKLQWACGSRVTSYCSSGVTVGTRTGVGLRYNSDQIKSRERQNQLQYYCHRPTVTRNPLPQAHCNS